MTRTVATADRGKFYWAASRRYLRDRHQFWVDQFAGLGSQGRESDKNICPRFHVLDAIAVEVDRLDPGRMPPPEEVLDWLETCGGAAEGIFTGGAAPGSVQKLAEAEERGAFLLFCAELKLAEAREVEPLPYRRTLSDHEDERYRSQVLQAWELDDLSFWEPLKQDTVRGRRTLALRAESFENVVGHEGPASIAVRQALANLGVNRVLELREYGPAFERAVETLECVYTGAEGFFFSDDFEWIIFASHEGVTTVGGTIVAELEQSWADLGSHVWVWGEGF